LAGEDVGEHGAGSKPELLGAGVEDGLAGDVGGHQVGGELDSAEPAAEGLAQDPHEQRLAEARHALDQHVAPGKERRQRQPHELRLADVDLGRLGEERIDREANLLEPRVGRRRGRCRGRERRRFMVHRAGSFRVRSGVGDGAWK
jgi:hypothetical protein